METQWTYFELWNYMLVYLLGIEGQCEFKQFKDRDYSYTLPAVSSRSDNEETLTLWLTVEIRSARRSRNTCLVSKESHVSLWEWWLRPWPFEIVSLDRKSGKPVRTAHEWTWAFYSSVCQIPGASAAIPTASSLSLLRSIIKRPVPESESQIQLPSLSRTAPFSGECSLTRSLPLLPHWGTLKTPHTSLQDNPQCPSRWSPEKQVIYNRILFNYKEWNNTIYRKNE